MIVGRLGMHQLGAVGLSNMVFFFVTVFFSFLLVVTTPRVADALAVDDRAQVQHLLKLPACALPMGSHHDYVRMQDCACRGGGAQGLLFTAT